MSEYSVYVRYYTDTGVGKVTAEDVYDAIEAARDLVNVAARPAGTDGVDYLWVVNDETVESEYYDC